MESVSLLDSSSSSSSSSSVHVAPSSSSSATDASDGDDVSPPVNPPRRLRRAPIGVFPAPTRSRVGVVPPGDSKDPSKDDRSPSDANGSSSAYACPRSGRVSGADRARESRRISFSRCRRPLGDVASGARVARRVGRVGVETDRSITGRWAFGPPTNSLSRRSLVAVALARILAIVASATGSENGCSGVGVGVSSGFAASSASSFSVVPSASGLVGRRSTEGTERARGSAMPRAAPVFGGASGAVSGRGAFDTASAAMSESIDVAPGASRGSGVSISADGCGTVRG